MGSKKTKPYQESVKGAVESLEQALESADEGKKIKRVKELVGLLEGDKLFQANPDRDDFVESEKVLSPLEDETRNRAIKVLELSKNENSLDSETTKRVNQVVKLLAQIPEAVEAPAQPVSKEARSLSAAATQFGPKPEPAPEAGEAASEAQKIKDQFAKSLFLTAVYLGNDNTEVLNQIGKAREGNNQGFKVGSRSELEPVGKTVFGIVREKFNWTEAPAKPLDMETVVQWLVENKADPDQIQFLDSTWDLEITFSDAFHAETEKKEDKEPAPKAEPEKPKSSEQTKMGREIVERLSKLNTEEGMVKAIGVYLNKSHSPKQKEGILKDLFRKWSAVKPKVMQLIKESKNPEELGRNIDLIKKLLNESKLGVVAKYAMPAGKVEAPTPTPTPTPVNTVPEKKKEPEAKKSEWTELANGKDEEWKKMIEGLESLTQGKPDEAKLVIDSLRLLELPNDKNPKLAEAQTRIGNHFGMIKKLDPKSEAFHKIYKLSWLKVLKGNAVEVETLLNPPKTHLPVAEAKEILSTFSLGDLEDVSQRVFEVLEKDPKAETDPRARQFLVQIQGACQRFIDELGLESMKTMKLEHAATESKKIHEQFEKNLKPLLERYQKKVKVEEKPKAEPEKPKTDEAKKGPVDSAQTEGKETPKTPQAESGTTGPTPPEPKTESTTTPAPENEAAKTEAVALSKRPKEKAEKLSAGVMIMLKNVVSKPELVSDENPICLAINALVKEKKLDVKKLTEYLKNPKFFEKEINREKIAAERLFFKLKDTENNQVLKVKLQDELDSVKEHLEGLKGTNQTNKDIEDKREKLLKRKNTIVEVIRDIDALTQREGRTLRHPSFKVVLGYSILYSLKDDNEKNIDEIYKTGEDLIRRQKEALYSGTRARVNKIGFFLRPNLESTLKAMAEDKDLAKIDKNPAEKLAELANLFGQTPQRVREWVGSLEGGMEKHIKTTVPRIIAYLEMAIRDGKVSYLMTTGRAEKLLKLLKDIQHDHIVEEIDVEFKKNPSLKNTDRAQMFLDMQNEMDAVGDKMAKEIIERHTNKTLALKGGALAATGALGIFAPIPLLSMLPAIASVPAYIAGHMGSTPLSEKNKEVLKRSAVRSFVGNALYLGGAALWGPLSIPLSVLGVLSPEIWKHRKAIYETGLKEYAWNKAIKPSGPVLGKIATGIGIVATAPIYFAYKLYKREL